MEPEWQMFGDNIGVRCYLYEPEFGKFLKSAPERQKSKKLDDAENQLSLGESNSSSEQPGSVESDSSKTLLAVEDLKVYFPIKKGVFQRNIGYVKAVDGVSIAIPPSHTMALVGESGCGKTTIGKGITQLIRPSAGKVMLGEHDLAKLSYSRLKSFRKEIQIIFQDPYSSMNPRMLVGDIIEEGMIAQRIGKNSADRKDKIDSLLEQVGLSVDIKNR